MASIHGESLGYGTCCAANARHQCEQASSRGSNRCCPESVTEYGYGKPSEWRRWERHNITKILSERPERPRSVRIRRFAIGRTREPENPAKNGNRRLPSQYAA